MPLLQVRNFPPDLYDKLRQQAAVDGLSITQETTQLVRQALNTDDARRARKRAILDRLAAFAEETGPSTFDVVAAIREDRDSR